MDLERIQLLLYLDALGLFSLNRGKANLTLCCSIRAEGEGEPGNVGKRITEEVRSKEQR